MRPRALRDALRSAARSFPAVVLTGPRQSGKTTLLRGHPGRIDYRLLEDPDEILRVREDPRGWTASCRPPVVVDEIQNAPEILPYIRSRIDRERGKGRWFLTGSQQFGLMKGVTESMAGRAAILTLWPFSIAETLPVGRRSARSVWSLAVRGFHPPVALRSAPPAIWHASYLQSYLERDVRQLTQVGDLRAFQLLLRLCAVRAGQVLSQTDLAGPLGVSVPTVARWLGILEATSQIVLVPPFHENLGKRLVKRPKIYFGDTGLLCYLLGLRDADEAARSPFAGAIFENLVLLEILKTRTNAGLPGEAYFFRDREGLEVDFIHPSGPALRLVEAKRGSTPRPDDARSIRKVLPLLTRGRRPCEAVVVTLGGPVGTVAPGIETLPVSRLERRPPTTRRRRPATFPRETR